MPFATTKPTLRFIFAAGWELQRRERPRGHTGTRAKRPTVVRKGCDDGGLVYVCVRTRHVLDLLPNCVCFDLFNHCRNDIPPCQLLNGLLAFVPNRSVAVKAWRLERGKARHVFKEWQHEARNGDGGGCVSESQKERAETEIN